MGELKLKTTEKTIKNETAKPSSAADVIRRCSTCKWAGEEYKLDGKKMGVKHRLFVQCLIMLPEEIRKLLPASYGRNIARYVGWEDETGKHYNTTGSECPTWKTQ